MTSKTCTKCGEEKPLEEFSKNRKSKDGLRCRCKDCEKQPQHLKKLVNHYPVASTKCSKCGKKKDAAEFYVAPTMKSGLSSYCKKCHKATAKVYYNTDRKRELWLRHEYGITVEQYETMLKAQNGGCAICGSTTSGGKGKHFAIDHNHETGKVRALLCNGCNRGLGFFDDDPDRLEAATKYLREHDG